MMPTRTALGLTVVLAAMLAAGRLAGAQPANPGADDRTRAADAAALYDEGKRHFDIGEYAQAIASWKQSYLLSSAPLLLFNIAQAYRLSGNCAQANRFYLNYRRVEKHPKNQAELDRAMARCAGVEPATGDAASEPPASPTGTGVTTGAATSPPAGAATEPAPAPSRAGTASPPSIGAPASHPDAASPPTSPGIAAQRSSEARRGVGTPTAPPTGRGAEPPVGSTGRGWRITGIVTGAVGVAALSAGGLYALAAKRDSDTVAGARFGTPYTGDVASSDSGGKTAASRAQGLLGIGAVLAVAGGVMWYTGHRQGAQLDVAIAPGHAEVALSCAF